MWTDHIAKLQQKRKNPKSSLPGTIKCKAREMSSGPGLPETSMIPWCEKLNDIDGLCTVQSCAGHGPDACGYRSSGHLWLRLSAPMMKQFIERGSDLAADLEHIERANLAITLIRHRLRDAALKERASCAREEWSTCSQKTRPKKKGGTKAPPNTFSFRPLRRAATHRKSWVGGKEEKS